MIKSSRLSIALIFVLFVAGTPAGADERGALIVEMFEEIKQLRKELQDLRNESELLRHQFEQLSRDNQRLSVTVKAMIEVSTSPEASTPTTTSPTSVVLPDSESDVATTVTAPQETTPTDVEDSKPLPVETPADETPEPPPEKEVEIPELPVKPSSVQIPPDDINEAEKQAYDQVIDYLNQGDFEQLQPALQNFLRDYGNGTYAAEAHYLLGEMLFEAGDTQSALTHFSRIAEQFADSDKLEAAQLKMAYIYYEQEDWARARQLLEALTDADDEQISRLAQKRLDRMASENR